MDSQIAPQQLSGIESGKDLQVRLIDRIHKIKMLMLAMVSSKKYKLLEHTNRKSKKQKYMKKMYSLPDDQEPQQLHKVSDEPSTSFKVEFHQRLFNKVKIDQFLESIAVTIIMTFITIYALFGDDVRVLATDKNGDTYFYIFHSITMAFFGIEIVLASIAKKDYALGFFFWLDLLSTLSMLLDIGWVSNAIFNSGSGGNATSAVSLARAGRASRIGTKAGRIVRIVRLIRLVKLYKHAQQALEKEAQKFEEERENSEFDYVDSEEQGLQQNIENIQAQNAHRNSIHPEIQPEIPIEHAPENVKVDTETHQQILASGLQQQNSQALMQSNHGQKQSTETPKAIARQLSRQFSRQASRINRQSTMNRKKGPNGEEIQTLNETKVGQKLSDLTTRRVITIVLSILFSVPIFALETYREDNVSYDNGLKLIYEEKNNSQILQDLFSNYIDYHEQQHNSVIYVELNLTATCCFYSAGNSLNSIMGNMRKADQLYYSYTSADVSQTLYILQGSLYYSIVSIVNDQQLNAILSIVRTIFVSIVLGASAILFSKDVQDYVKF